MQTEVLEKANPVCVVGLGYVGLPLALTFAERYNVIGFDIDVKKLDCYRRGFDPGKEIGQDEFQKVKDSVLFTDDANHIRESKFIIIAVPTPVDESHIPNLSLLKSASETVGSNLAQGAIVIYESTVYPGVTRDFCMPILEKCSGKKCGRDFHIGYSPERINPGDKQHTVRYIRKIVSAMDQDKLDKIASVYASVIEAGVYKASSIEVAEAAKVIENSQRDINIAFVNELSIIFNKLDLDTHEILEAASTKWNFFELYTR